MTVGNGAARAYPHAYTKGAKRRQPKAKRPTTKQPEIIVRHQVTITRAVIEPENLRWFVLRVTSQKEEAVVRVFDMIGIPAAIPTAQREARRRGRIFRWRVPIAPGYVLVGFPGDGAIPWREVYRFGLVHKPICDESDRPLQAPWRTHFLHNGQLKTRCGVDGLLGDLDEIRSSAAKYMRVWPTYEADELVRVDAGPFKGHQGRVQSTDENEARVLLMIFGRATVAQLPIADLAKAEAA